MRYVPTRGLRAVRVFAEFGIAWKFFGVVWLSLVSYGIFFEYGFLRFFGCCKARNSLHITFLVLMSNDVATYQSITCELRNLDTTEKFTCDCNTNVCVHKSRNGGAGHFLREWVGLVQKFAGASEGGFLDSGLVQKYEIIFYTSSFAVPWYGCPI